MTMAAAVALFGPGAGSWAADDELVVQPVSTRAEKANAKRPENEEPKDAPSRVAANEDGFTIQSEDGSFKLKLSGHLQGDARFYASDRGHLGINSFLLRRVRPIVQGTVGQYFDFNLTPDFALGQAVIQDAFLDTRFSDAFRIKVGKFKSPVGYELLDADATLTVVERGLPIDLVPNRDIGLELHGELGGGVVSYQAGVFNGAVDGGSLDADTNDGKDLEGRLFLEPFKNSSSATFKGLGIGIAGTTGKQLGAVPTFKTVGQVTFFSYGQSVTADGTRTRVAPQAAYDHGPLHVFGEWVSSRQRLRKSASETLEARNTSWQAFAALVLTGERLERGWVTPKRSFDPAKGAFGAVALAVRCSRLDVDDAIFAAGYADPSKSARSSKQWGVAIDWYLTHNVKYIASYDQTTFMGGAASANREAENAIMLRAQVSF